MLDREGVASITTYHVASVTTYQTCEGNGRTQCNEKLIDFTRGKTGPTIFMIVSSVSDPVSLHKPACGADHWHTCGHTVVLQPAAQAKNFASLEFSGQGQIIRGQ
eukprot:756306-Hanusia_phi.AAC.1